MPATQKITLECSSCAATVRGPESAVGKTLTCPKCKAKALFELKLELAPIEAAPERAPAPEPEAPLPPPERALSDEACSGCGELLEEGAIICVSCGRDQRLGLKVETVAAAKSAGSFGLAVAAGLGVAILGGVIWATLAVYVRTQFGYVAVGIGAAAAFVVGTLTDERSIRTGIAAMSIAVLGLLIGKVLMVNGLATAVFEDSLITNRPALVKLLVYDKVQRGELDEAVAEAYLDKEAPVDAETRAAAGKLEIPLRSELKGLGWDRKRALIAPVVDRFLDGLSYFDRIKMASGFWDLLWFSLALAAAWKIVEPESYGFASA